MSPCWRLLIVCRWLCFLYQYSTTLTISHPTFLYLLSAYLTSFCRINELQTKPKPFIPPAYGQTHPTRYSFRQLPALSLEHVGNSNTLITPKRSYYAFDITPSYWQRRIEIRMSKLVFGADCEKALGLNISDYEDALIATCAERSRIEYIVTRQMKILLIPLFRQSPPRTLLLCSNESSCLPI